MYSFYSALRKFVSLNLCHLYCPQKLLFFCMGANPRSRLNNRFISVNYHFRPSRTPLWTLRYSTLLRCTLAICSEMKVQLQLNFLSSALSRRVQRKRQDLHILRHVFTSNTLLFHYTRFMHMYPFIFYIFIDK